jgi:hypothetical protein
MKIAKAMRLAGFEKRLEVLAYPFFLPINLSQWIKIHQRQPIDLDKSYPLFI